MDEDFYMILPSNSCPITQPENTGSLFIVDWDTTIRLRGYWKVALTEFALKYKPPPPRTTPMKLTYSRQGRANVEITLEGYRGSFVSSATYDSSVRVVLKDGKTLIDCDLAPFKITFDSMEEALLLGFTQTTILSSANQLMAEKPIGSQAFKSTFFITYTGILTLKEVIPFSAPFNFNTAGQLQDFISEHTSQIFTVFKIDQNGFFTFSLKPEIIDVIFDNELSDFLGVLNTLYINLEGKLYRAPNKPKLDDLFKQVYIYSNVVQPVHVGGVLVPLLKSLWIENKYKTGEVVSEVIDKPMYFPVSFLSINNIEINIRDDTGHLLDLPLGSKTSLTLHFQRHVEYGFSKPI